MLEEHNRRDKAHLTNLIRMRNDETPIFALLIGAGASATSGAKTSRELIAEWRRQLYAQYKSRKSLEKWLEEQDWYKDEEEYSILFEKVCDRPSQRRNFVEECIKDATPSWGYIYLANIIALNYFNVIFTPNFDDLLNEACCTYGCLRPLVCAHDSAVADIRVTSARPKIIKLHGDFLYDSIKTTLTETASLESNMRDKLRQFGKEYGLVVIGYGGGDKSIMDTLEMLLSESAEGFFPHGLYWCRQKEAEVSKRLRRLMLREKAYWVEVEGFDEFMAEIHDGLALTLPDTVRDPYRATTERLNRFILPKGDTKHPIIQKDIKQVEAQIKDFEQVISGQKIEEFDRLVPYQFLGDAHYESYEYGDALDYYEKAALQSPNDRRLLLSMFQSYLFEENFVKASEICERAIEQYPSESSGYSMKGDYLVYSNNPEDAIQSYTEALERTAKKGEPRAAILGARANARLVISDWEGALSDAEKALQISTEEPVFSINKAIALKALGKKEEANAILKATLSELGKTTENTYHRASIFSVLGDRKKMLKALESAIEQDKRYRMTARIDPDFAEYREDPDFQKLIH